MTTLFGLLGALPGAGTAVVVPELNIRVSYEDLRSQVEDAASALAAAGVSGGDRIGIALPNGLPMIVALLAASMTGIAAPFNPRSTEEEFRFCLDDTGARVLLVPPHGADAARRAARNSVRAIDVGLNTAGRVMVSGAGPRRSIQTPSIGDVALILHTSGSTGQPKRVALTHAMLTTSATHVAEGYALSPSDSSLCVMPLFHVHGLVASALATLATGGTVVVPTAYSPWAFRRLAAEYGVTWYSAAPTVHQILLARTDPASDGTAHLKQLRFMRSCSAALPSRVLQGLEAAFGVPVLEAFGMTEAAHQIASNLLPPAERKPGSVGKATGVSISLIDPTGRHLGTGERGEVVIQGPTVISGYDNDRDADATSFAHGWFRTGDEGTLDADGYLTLAGRLKEIINRGGEKIAPQEVDRVLSAHPAVVEAVAFGVPHSLWGEEVAAAVVLQPASRESERTLIGYCRDRLADHKCPRKIYILSQIPRSATGKLQRRVVAAALLGHPTTG